MQLKLPGKIALLLVAGALIFAGYRKFGTRLNNGGGGQATPATAVSAGSSQLVSSGGEDLTGAVLDRPLRVGLVSWPGYAGGIFANNGFKPNTNCIFWKDHKLEVEFLLLEDIDARGKAFAKGGPQGVDIVWSTVDFWANELPGLKKNGVDARALMQVDWSRGGDAIVADASIKKIEDLKGKKISLVEFTPSHWLLEYNLQNSSLSDSDQSEINHSLINSASTMDARNDFLQDKVDATVVWEPDVTAALQRPGSHILVSSATASNLIADVMVAQESFIKAHPQACQAFVEGWMDGAIAANRDTGTAAQLLMDNEPLYKQAGESVTRDGLSKVRLADLNDNARMFGLDGSPPLFDKLFKAASDTWTKLGIIPYPVAPSEAKDDEFLRRMYRAHPVAVARQEYTFAKPTPALEKKAPILTKPVRIQFASDSAQLSDAAKKQLAPVATLAQSYGNAYLRIEGNTVGQGNAFGMKLSRARAQTVASYLVHRFGLTANRFMVKGNGPYYPVASSATAAGRALNRRTDIMVIPKN